MYISIAFFNFINALFNDLTAIIASVRSILFLCNLFVSDYLSRWQVGRTRAYSLESDNVEEISERSNHGLKCICYDII